MALPRIHGVRVPLFTLSAAAVAAALWFLRPTPEIEPEPVRDWSWLEQELLEPVAGEQMTLAQLQQYPGSLWLQVRPDASRLLYRAEFERAAVQWRLQAEVSTTAGELQRLRRELQLDNAERQLQAEQVPHFVGHSVASLWLNSTPKLSADAWQVSAGEPRLRLQMPEGQAWVYPPRGLTAHVEDGQIILIQQVPARAMRGNGR